MNASGVTRQRKGSTDPVIVDDRAQAMCNREDSALGKLSIRRMRR